MYLFVCVNVCLVVCLISCCRLLYRSSVCLCYVLRGIVLELFVDWAFYACYDVAVVLVCSNL